MILDIVKHAHRQNIANLANVNHELPVELVLTANLASVLTQESVFEI